MFTTARLLGRLVKKCTGALLGGTLLALACSSSTPPAAGSVDIVGASCKTDADCPSSWCVHDRNYPGGMCSVHCQSDADCLMGTVCVQDAGGMCALPCTTTEACMNVANGNYVCSLTAAKGKSGTLYVCRGY
jgi:hypothetical protein